MIIINAFSGVTTIFLVVLLGFYLKRKGWIPDEFTKLLPKFITSIVLPPFLLRSVTGTFQQDQLLGLLTGIWVPALSVFISFGLGALLGQLFKVHAGRRGCFRVAIATSNTMNIGLPINVALFGETAIPYVLLYFFVNCTFFWTIGNYTIAHDGESASVKMFSMASLKQIFSPPLIGFFIGIALVLLDWHLPVFLDKAFKYVGDMAIPLFLIFIGITLTEISPGELKPEKDSVLVLLGRFVISPLTIIALSYIFPIPALARDVFIIQASLPVMLNAALIAAYYKADAKFMTVVVSGSTLLSIITIPLWAVLASWI